jgi:hypothetical protein
VDRISEFLLDIDSLWGSPSAETVDLHVIGATALMLQTDFERGTKDSDVLETYRMMAEAKARLIDLAGQGTTLHARHRLYIDLVPNGLPFLPSVPRFHPHDALNPQLRHFRVYLLDVVDVVVSKLKRFHANDQSDVAAMIRRELVSHDRLVERFRAAVDVFAYDARASELPRYVANLHRVERDQYDVAETEIDLPDWI